MSPADLKLEDFSSYPPQGQQMAEQQLPLLQKLPVVLTAILLKEVTTYDWKFPAERHSLDAQFAWLGQLSSDQLAQVMQGFASVQIEPQLARENWARDPGAFVERLTAMLWSTHQMDRFRSIADAYATRLHQQVQPRKPSQPRLGIVVVGEGVDQNTYTLFRKLKPQGAFLTNVDPTHGWQILLEAVVQRAQSDTGTADPFQHWYIDGGRPPLPAHPKLTVVTYDGLDAARHALLVRTQRAIQSGSMGPEALRTLLAQMRPEEIGLSGSGDQAVLNHFQVDLLTQGAGTQIFATTFVQWAARECLRRAQAETVLLRFAPRQRLQPMNELLSGARGGAPDPMGSLIDADMGAYYTWINMLRLPDADNVRFLAWFEGHREAVIVGPGIPKGVVSNSAMNLQKAMSLWA